MHSADLVVLSNHQLRFFDRLYAAFDADIKRIKLIKPLDAILSRYLIHNIYICIWVISNRCFVFATLVRRQNNYCDLFN